MVELRRLTWFTALAPTLFVFVVELTRHRYVEPWLGWEAAHVIAMLAILAGAYLFSLVTLGYIKRITDENRALQESLATAAERERIAREMHDGFAQRLGYLNLKVDGLEAILNGTQAPALDDLRPELRDMKQVIQEAYADVRQLLFDLKTTAQLANGVFSALAEWMAEFERRTHLAVHTEYRCDPSYLVLSPLVEVQLFRIIQEAFTNVRKHARASQVWVSFECPDGRQLQVEVRDDGRGFDPSHPGSGQERRFGLGIMEERARGVGGSLTIQSTPGGGTTVRVAVPLARPVAMHPAAKSVAGPGKEMSAQ